VRPILLILLLLPAPLAAQWSVTLRGGSATERGHSLAADDPDRPQLRPDHPATLEVALARALGAWRVSVAGRHRSADLVVSGETAAVVSKSALTAWGVSVEVARRVAGTPTRATLHTALGVAFDHWDVGIADDARTRPEARAALEAAVPVHGAWSGVLRGELAAGGALFRDNELPQGYRRRMGWSTGMMLGLRWGR
jgi:hypothetical protein